VTVELLAIILNYFAFEKFGRKIPYTTMMFLSGASLLATYFVPKGDLKIKLSNKKVPRYFKIFLKIKNIPY